MGLLSLPDELLETIIQHLGPADTAAFGGACKHADRIANSALIWRKYCVENRAYWDARHGLREKLLLPPAQTEWRRLFSERSRADRDMLTIYNEMLLVQRYRYQRMEQIAKQGRDAMDILSRLEVFTPDSAADVLARRYYATAILEQLRRADALGIWLQLGRGEPVSLEEALGAFDTFVYPGSYPDAVSLSIELDDTAQKIRISREEFDALPPRRKAILIAEALRSEHLLGMRDESKYHALGNNFLGQAFTLCSSLPLQSAAFYCSVARRLGVDAVPSNFPQHVHVIIRAPGDQTLDGASRNLAGRPDIEQECMFMDPWRNSEEVPEDQLRNRLTQMGIPRGEHMKYLGPASVVEMTLRTARNIMVSVEEARHRPEDPADPFSFPYVETAWYAMLWVMVILGDVDDRAAFTRRRQFIPYLVQHFQSHSPEDIPMIALVPPLFEDRREHQVLLDMVAANREADTAERTVKQRDGMNAGVQYRIGHYFRHKRYGYEGFIIGWDAHCAAGQQWITQMRVDELPRGREQPFYNIVADDRSVRYVAEVNIELICERPSPGTLMGLAGRYFKRWDDVDRKFVSNILDDYPDD